MRTCRRTLGSNRRLAWPAKPPFTASISMSGTGTASVYRVWRSHPVFPTRSVIRHPCAARPARRLRSGPKRRPNPHWPRRHRDIPGAGWKTGLIFLSRALSGRPSSPINAPTTGVLPLYGAFRRGGRVVECTALEMRHRCKPIGGSNPSLSASSLASDRHFRTPKTSKNNASGLPQVCQCRSVYPPM